MAIKKVVEICTHRGEIVASMNPKQWVSIDIHKVSAKPVHLFLGYEVC